jgi:hypothetical protein
VFAVRQEMATKEARKKYSLIVGPTWDVPTGNQTITAVTDPTTNREYRVTLIWENQGNESLVASPFQIRIESGNAEPFSGETVERRLGIAKTRNNYPITSTLMRKIPYERIIDDSRRCLLAANKWSLNNNIDLIHPLSESNLIKPTKTGRPFDRDENFYLKVAKYYLEAMSLGGSVARKPATHIATYLQAEIGHLKPEAQHTQIRKWVAEARKRGFLHPAQKVEK